MKNLCVYVLMVVLLVTSVPRPCRACAGHIVEVVSEVHVACCVAGSDVVHRQYTRTVFIATVTPTSMPTPTPTPTPVPTPTLTPTPGPFGDVHGNPAPAPDLYPWADWEWRDYAAHIVAGECANEQPARRVIACTLIRDVLNDWSPYKLTKRWYGWKTPSWNDRMAVWDALQPGGCEELPWYRYVGSKSDRLVWISKGVISSDAEYDVYGKTIGIR